jgi:hypothetical protein
MIISPHMEREIRRRALAVKPTNSDETPLFFLFYWIIEVGPQHDYP